MLVYASRNSCNATMQAEKIAIPGTSAASSKPRKRLSIRELLQPHRTALVLGFLAVAGESAANLLGPWPLKIVLQGKGMEVPIGTRAVVAWAHPCADGLFLSGLVSIGSWRIGCLLWDSTM